MTISCPISPPQPDIITMGHGSGGLLTHQLLQTGVFNLLKNDLLDQQHDGAVFMLHDRVAFTTDSYVVTPIFFPGGDIGHLAVNGTVNDLAMCGASARYLSLSFIIEEGFPLSDFQRILQSIKEAAGRAGVTIVTGDTKVVERGKGDKIYINTSGIGIVHPAASIHHNRIEVGDRIIINGNIARHGITIMSLREGLEFQTTLTSDTTALNGTIASLIGMFGADIKFLRDATRGGVASVLNEVSEITGFGILLDQATIPVQDQVEGACEMLGLDPLYVANEGVFIAVVKDVVAKKLLEYLRGDSNGRDATVVGTVTSDHPGKVVMKSRVGGRRVVNRLTGEQLPRIC